MARKNDINFDYNSEVKKCKTIDDVNVNIFLYKNWKIIMYNN